MDAARGAVVDALSVVLTGFRLAFRHLPTLVVIFLLGAAARNGVLWAAVEISDWNRTVAGFLLPLAPMATLTAIVLMLRVAASSLPWATFEGGRGRYLGLLAGTLIPFLTVYAAQGYLEDDLRDFINAATYDEIFGKADVFYGRTGDVSRSIIADGWLLAAIIAVALVLRFLISRFDLPSRHVGFGMGAAYVEVLWLFLLAAWFNRYFKLAWDWVYERRFVDWVQDRWAAFLDVVGPFKAPLDSLMHAFGSFLTDADAVLLIPIAWLTVGAVALGRKVEAPSRADRRRAGVVRYAQRVPAVVRRAGVEATADLRGRFSSLGNGLRLLAVGGLLPMLLFCLVFVVARQGGNLTLEAWRLVAGPVERDTGIAFAPYLTVMSDAVYTVLLATLLAAAIDRITARQRADVEPQPTGSSA